MLVVEPTHVGARHTGCINPNESTAHTAVCGDGGDDALGNDRVECRRVYPAMGHLLQAEGRDPQGVENHGDPPVG